MFNEPKVQPHNIIDFVLSNEEPVNDQGLTCAGMWAYVQRYFENVSPENILELTLDYDDAVQAAPDIMTAYLFLARLRGAIYNNFGMWSVGDFEDAEFNFNANYVISRRIEDVLDAYNNGDPIFHIWIN